jgi:hypothetical protein
MANAVYPIYKTAILTAGTNTSLDQDTTTDGPYCTLIDTGNYTYSAAHDFYNDVTATNGVVWTAGRITTPTVGSVAAGTFDGDDTVFTAVTTATSIEALIVHRQNSGANTTWRLVFYEDTSVTGLPVTPNGGDITVAWNASGILLI